MNEPPKLEIQLTSWQEGEAALSQIRREVFIEEQNVPAELEWDNHDRSPDTRHYLAISEGAPVGCARLLKNGHIGRLAVRQPFRGHGIGNRLLRKIVQDDLYQQYCEARDGDTFLHAQTNAIPFYQKLGFCVIGNVFMDAGIPHKTMVFEATHTTLQTLYGEEVLRLNHCREFQFHLAQAINYGSRSLCIYSNQLHPVIWGDSEVAQAISRLARKSRNSSIRILLEESTPLAGSHHPLLTLTQRLTTHTELRVVNDDIASKEQAYAIIDKRQLIYFNNEQEMVGFANYNAAAESRNLEEDFQRLWDHGSYRDPNLSQLFI